MESRIHPAVVSIFMLMHQLTVHKQDFSPVLVFLEQWPQTKACLSPTWVCCVHLSCCQIDPARFAAASSGTKARGWGWEKVTRDQEDNNKESKSGMEDERGKGRLQGIWDEWGSRRGQGHSRGKQSISLTHTLRDILCLRDTLFSSSSSEKKSVRVCLCFSQ